MNRFKYQISNIVQFKMLRFHLMGMLSLVQIDIIKAVFEKKSSRPEYYFTWVSCLSYVKITWLLRENNRNFFNWNSYKFSKWRFSNNILVFIYVVAKFSWDLFQSQFPWNISKHFTRVLRTRISSFRVWMLREIQMKFVWATFWRIDSGITG